MAQTFRRLTNVGWAALVVVAVVCAVFVIRDSAATPATYSSGNDVTYPGAGCAPHGRQVVTVQGSDEPVRDGTGRRIGIVRLRRSLICETVWAQVLLSDTAARQLKGRTIEIVALRPADNRRARYLLTLQGETGGFGNQLAATACITGSAQLLGSGNRPAGPLARTPCLS